MGRTLGLQIPAFIHNMQYHYAPLAVYGDGLVDCWGSVDLDIFLRKLKTGWVVTEAPPGSMVCFHNLGSAIVRTCDWKNSPADLLKRVNAGINSLNPDRSGLINLNGEEAEMRGKVRYSKFGLTNGKPYRVDADGNEVLGDSIPVFLQAGSDFQLKPWFIYADGSSRVGRTGSLKPLNEVATGLTGGDLRTSAPDGSRITIEGLGWFESKSSGWHVKPEERVREAYDALEKLKGEQGAMRNCMNCFREYQTDLSLENRDRLRLAYEAVPEHLRHYCGDMDSQDWPIRRIIYGEETETRRP
ncbi:MAG: hypothetical protein ABSF28_06545 [Terracidiphilus sp.]